MLDEGTADELDEGSSDELHEGSSDEDQSHSVIKVETWDDERKWNIIKWGTYTYPLHFRLWLV